MAPPEHVLRLRVRYGETDQMGTYYNSRVLDWFECGRTEFLRALGIPYAEMEAKGVFLPIVEAHLHYRGRARYDDEIILTTTAALHGKARVRFDVRIVRAAGGDVADGYTIHAITDAAGKPIRPPSWLARALENHVRP
jgi:acyl-CoA thioester hydrolase